LNSLSWDFISNRSLGLFRKAIYNHTRSYSIWELKSYVQSALGHTPTNWASTRALSLFRNSQKKNHKDHIRLQGLPIGSFIGLAVTLTYTMKTDNLPLKIGVGKPKESIAQAVPLRRN
jgi:hypothetical protein